MDTAIAAYKEAIRLKPDYVGAHNNLGWAYYKKGLFAKAEPHYKRALAIREKALGPDHPKVVITLINLAKLRFAQGQLAEAESLLKRMVEILDRAGPKYPNAAKDLERVATLYEKLGKYEEAGKLLVRADRIRERQ